MTPEQGDIILIPTPFTDLFLSEATTGHRADLLGDEDGFLRIPDVGIRALDQKHRIAHGNLDLILRTTRSLHRPIKESVGEGILSQFIANVGQGAEGAEVVRLQRENRVILFGGVFQITR